MSEYILERNPTAVISVENPSHRIVIWGHIEWNIIWAKLFGEIPHTCEICEKSFSQKVTLYHHTLLFILERNLTAVRSVADRSDRGETLSLTNMYTWTVEIKDFMNMKKLNSQKIVVIILKWVTSWENLFLPYVNNKGADQTAHPRRLICAFIVHCLDSQ